MCGAEIDNGGFEQLFTNSTEVVPLAVEGVRLLELDPSRRGTGGGRRAVSERRRAARLDRRIDEWEAVRDRGGTELERLDALEERWFALSDELDRRLGEFAREREAEG
jgi:hypothetical protein